MQFQAVTPKIRIKIDVLKKIKRCKQKKNGPQTNYEHDKSKFFGVRWEYIVTQNSKNCLKGGKLVREGYFFCLHPVIKNI